VADNSKSLIKSAGRSPLLLVLGAAILWSTGGLFIKATHLSPFEVSFGRSFSLPSRLSSSHATKGFGLNRISAITSVLYSALLILFVVATKMTTAATRFSCNIRRLFTF
jgi:hypothetical protein